MKKLLFLFVFTAAALFSKAQHRELGFTSSAQIGFGYGTFYDINVIMKWGGDHFVQRARIPRTYMNISNYQGQQYNSMSTGLFYGLEWRKDLTEDLQFTQGTELGGYLNVGTNYENYSPSVRYFLGLRYHPKPRLAFALELPSSIMTSFYKTNDEWQANRNITAGIFNETSLFTITYDLRKP